MLTVLEQIKASAGSGKTHILTLRFLERLSHLRPEGGSFAEILAMTFTNKAAAEMKDRVLQTLKLIALRGEAPYYPELAALLDKKQAERWLKIILRRYDALNIRTIDSLLNLLVRLSAVTLRLPPNFDLAFDERDYLAPLYDELLDAAEQNDADALLILGECAACMLNHNKFARFTPGDRMRAQLLDILAILQKSDAPGLPCLEESTLLDRQRLCVAELRASSKLLREAVERRGLLLNHHCKSLLDALDSLLPGHPFPSVNMLAKESFASCCLKSSLPPDLSMEEIYRKFCKKALENKSRLHLYASALSFLPYTRAATDLLRKIERLHRQFSSIPITLLSKLAEKTLNAEYGVSEACCRLGSRLSHLLIDEFQDTSREQWEVLKHLVVECLSRGGSLYYVGDVKQAIYSWRGGEAELFDKVSGIPDIAAIDPGVSSTLPMNWRSAPEIVLHNNRFFSQLTEPDFSLELARALLPRAYPETEIRKAADSLVSAFTGCAQELPPAKKDSASGFVRIQNIETENSAELWEKSKDALGALFTIGPLARRRCGDIAVLTRNGKEADFAAQCLLEYGVSVITEHSFKLGGNPFILRIIALLRFLAYPPDNMNFINFIAGPEIFPLLTGLSGEELFRWEAGVLLEARPDKSAKNLFTLFARDFPEAWITWLEPFYHSAGLMSAYDLIHEIVNRYTLLTLRPEQGPYLRRFLEIALAAERAGFSSLASFLDYWDEQGHEEKVPSSENPDAVRIMTIHKAKGLEFSVVVLPFHRFTGKTESEYALLNCDGLPLLARLDAEAGQAYYRKTNTSALESMHLLYVAWTRAQEELYAFTGGTRRDISFPGLPRAMRLLLKAFPFNSEGVYSSGTPLPARARPLQYPAIKDAAPPKPDADWRPMGWLPLLKIFRNPVSEPEYDQKTRGTLFHLCLENLYLPEKGPERDRLLPTYVEQALSKALRLQPPPQDKLEHIRGELRESLLWFCSLPDAPAWLRAGRREQSILDQDYSYRLDMLTMEGPGRVLALEYKSGLPYQEHCEQLRRYLRLIQACGFGRVEGNPPSLRGLLVYLDTKELRELCL